MRATIPIGIPPGTKILRIERMSAEWIKENKTVDRYIPGEWRIWLNANFNFTLGTQLILYSDGRIDNVTQHEDGTETVFEVKGTDK